MFSNDYFPISDFMKQSAGFTNEASAVNKLQNAIRDRRQKLTETLPPSKRPRVD